MARQRQKEGRQREGGRKTDREGDIETGREIEGDRGIGQREREVDRERGKET